MKFYVAGKFSDADVIRTYMNELERWGHTITEDWTPNYARSVDPKFNMTEAYMSKCAMNDGLGVTKADVVLAILTDPEYEYRGTWTEIGMGLGAGKVVLVYHPMDFDKSKQAQNVFFHSHQIQKYRDWGKLEEDWDIAKKF